MRDEKALVRFQVRRAAGLLHTLHHTLHPQARHALAIQRLPAPSHVLNCDFKSVLGLGWF